MRFVSEKDHEELKKYAEKLTQLNTKLQKELQDCKDKLKHLEDIAKFNSNTISIGSNEEELCKLEIHRLYQASKLGPLEFNEVKAFEIYVKSLMLIRGKSVAEEKKKSKTEQASITNEQLLQLAMQVADDSNEQ
jgi:hypothetical protein